MSTIKNIVVRFRKELLQKGEIALQKPELIKAVECIIRLALAMLLSRAEIFGGYTPFGVAIVAVSGAGIEGLFALAGAIAGSFLGGEFLWGLKYMSIAILVYAAALVFHDIKFYQKKWFMPCMASFMAACTGFVYVADAGWTLSATIFFLTETILVGGAAYFYSTALSTWADSEQLDESQEVMRTVSILILISTCLIPLSGLIPVGGISVGRLLATLILMIAAYKGGFYVGSATGAVLGLAMDAGAGGAPFFSMAYAFSGLLSGIFNKHGKLLFCLSLILANAVSVLWTWDTVFNTAILYEVFISSVIFMLLPARVMARFPINLGTGVSYYGGVRIREYSKGRVQMLSEAFKDLYMMMKNSTIMEKTNDNDVAMVFDRAADVCCRTCGRSGECWHENYVTTLDAMNDATGSMMERGRLKLEDLPVYFSENCKNLEGYIDAVNQELKALLYRRQFKSRFKESREAVFGQYFDMSGILENVATELSSDLTFEPYAERKLRRYLRSIEIEGESAVFRDRNSRLHVEIKGGNLRPLTKDTEGLDKLSGVLGVRLCEKEETARQEVWLMEAEPLAAAVGIASVKRRGQVVSGDRGTYFKTDDGILYVILSDGMGTGDEAARESGQTIRILERFLKAGMNPAAALKVLNSAMLMKSSESLGYATVDLMCVNLFTGVAQMFKYGAAPSYIKKGKTIRKINGESMAAGLVPGENSLPDVMSINMGPGNFAVIVSDGIAGEADDAWIRKLISEYSGTQSKELARIIMEKAVDRNGCEDDMTVLTIFLEERC